MYKVVCINNVNDKQILSIDEKKYNIDDVLTTINQNNIKYFDIIKSHLLNNQNYILHIIDCENNTIGFMTLLKTSENIFNIGIVSINVEYNGYNISEMLYNISLSDMVNANNIVVRSNLSDDGKSKLNNKLFNFNEKYHKLIYVEYDIQNNNNYLLPKVSKINQNNFKNHKDLNTFIDLHNSLNKFFLSFFNSFKNKKIDAATYEKFYLRKKEILDNFQNLILKNIENDNKLDLNKLINEIKLFNILNIDVNKVNIDIPNEMIDDVLIFIKSVEKIKNDLNEFFDMLKKI